MATILVQAQVSTDALYEAVKQMPNSELDVFLQHVLSIHAKRRAPHLSHTESELLLRINEPIRAMTQARFDELVGKRDAGTLTQDEHSELLALIDEIELRDADRVAALVELAQVRGVSLDEVMVALGIDAAHA